MAVDKDKEEKDFRRDFMVGDQEKETGGCLASPDWPGESHSIHLLTQTFSSATSPSTTNDCSSPKLCLNIVEGEA